MAAPVCREMEDKMGQTSPVPVIIRGTREEGEAAAVSLQMPRVESLSLMGLSGGGKSRNQDSYPSSRAPALL